MGERLDEARDGALGGVDRPRRLARPERAAEARRGQHDGAPREGRGLEIVVQHLAEREQPLQAAVALAAGGQRAEMHERLRAPMSSKLLEEPRGRLRVARHSLGLDQKDALAPLLEGVGELLADTGLVVGDHDRAAVRQAGGGRDRGSAGGCYDEPADALLLGRPLSKRALRSFGRIGAGRRRDRRRMP